MKIIAVVTLSLSCWVTSCKNPSPTPTDNSDVIITQDSVISGKLPISPDSLDSTLPVDSTSYNVDSIKNSK